MGYTYLIGGMLALALWAVLFLHRKDVRKEMLFVSIALTLIGLLLEGLVWIRDWWRPEIFTGTAIGIEDAIFGFAMGGIAAVIYEELFRRKLNVRKKKRHNVKEFLLLTALFPIITLIAFFALGWHSFPSTILGLLIPAIIILIRRRDLIADALVTGTILAVLAAIGFFVLNTISPGFVYRWWLLDNLSGIIVAGVPLEDLAWFFSVGLFLGPIYEFWQNARLVKAKG